MPAPSPAAYRPGDDAVRGVGDPAAPRVVSGWALGWTFPGGQRLIGGWNGTFAPAGNTVSVKDVGWNRTIAPGGTAQSIGFVASGSPDNATPNRFTLNGVSCH